MKLTKEDIKKFATEDEKKVLEGAGRPTTKSQILRYKVYVLDELRICKDLFQYESWGELAEELEETLSDVKKLMRLTKTDYTFRGK